jgi:hypothetical protein
LCVISTTIHTLPPNTPSKKTLTCPKKKEMEKKKTLRGFYSNPNFKKYINFKKILKTYIHLKKKPKLSTICDERNAQKKKREKGDPQKTHS